MRSIVLEKIVVSAFPPINRRCLWLKDNTFYFWRDGAWRSVDSNVSVNTEYIDSKVNEVVSETVSEEITKVVGNASEEFDTLEELEAYAKAHAVEAEARGEAIAANTEAIEDLEQKLSEIDPEGSGWTDVE